MATSPNSLNNPFISYYLMQNPQAAIQLQQQQALAQQLMAEGNEPLPNETQMAGNVAIARSPLEYAGKAADKVTGALLQKQYMERLADMLQENQQSDQQSNIAEKALAAGAAQGDIGPTNTNAARMAEMLHPATASSPGVSTVTSPAAGPDQYAPMASPSNAFMWQAYPDYMKERMAESAAGPMAGARASAEAPYNFQNVSMTMPDGSVRNDVPVSREWLRNNADMMRSGSPQAAPGNGVGGQPVNNPGNLRPVGATTGFRQFATPEEGMQALKDDLTAKINGSPAMQGNEPTLGNVISAYAPPNENNTGAYQNFVSQKTGIPLTQKLTAQDIDKLAPVMAQYEGNSASTSSSPTLGVNPAAVKKSETQAQEEGKNIADAEKSVANITARIKNANKILDDMIDLAPKTGVGWYGENVSVPASRNLGTDEKAKNQSLFEQNNSNLFTQELPGIVQASGGRIDIPLINAIKSASAINPYAGVQEKVAMANNLKGMLGKLQDNAIQNYEMQSGKKFTMPADQNAQKPSASSQATASAQDIVNELRKRGVVQ